MADDDNSDVPKAAAPDWEAPIAAAQVSLQTQTIKANTFLRRGSTFSQPVFVTASDGQDYVVKGLRLPPGDLNQAMGMFNDQVAARLGSCIGAPVPEVVLIEVTAELIALNPDPALQMGHLAPGLAHASAIIADVTDRVDGLEFFDEGDNRERFAAMAVFTAWLSGGDRQFIYKKSPPRTVFSHDHGHYFPGGPAWTAAGLNGAAPPAVGSDMHSLSLIPSDYSLPIAALASVTDTDIAEILAIPPVEWGVALSDRAALGAFLACRRDAIVAAHLPTGVAS